MAIHQRLGLYARNWEHTERIYMRHGDTNRVLDLFGRDFDVADYDSASVNIEHSGAYDFIAAEISGSDASIDCDVICAAYGDVRCLLQLVDSDKHVSSLPFIVTVV